MEKIYETLSFLCRWYNLESHQLGRDRRDNTERLHHSAATVATLETTIEEIAHMNNIHMSHVMIKDDNGVAYYTYAYRGME